MKRKIISMLASVFIIFSLGGCNKSTVPVSLPSETRVQAIDFPVDNKDSNNTKVYSVLKVKEKAIEKSIETLLPFEEPPGNLDEFRQNKLRVFKVSRGYEVEKPKVSPQETNATIKQETSQPALPADFFGIPVLMYHSIYAEPGNELRVPEEKFEEQMKYLKDNGYTTLTMQEAYNTLIKGREVPKKAIVITFDDGYRDNYEKAYPILKKYDQKATIYLITALLNTDWNLTIEQVKEMYANGIDFESHTVNHENLSSLSYEVQLKTMKNAKLYLDKLLNKQVLSIAYPFGKYNNNTLKAAAEAGYSLAFTTKGGFARRGNGMLTLKRVRVNASDSIKTFADKITTQR